MACTSCGKPKERQAPEQPAPREQWCVGEGEEERCFDLPYDARSYAKRLHLGYPTHKTIPW